MGSMKKDVVLRQIADSSRIRLSEPDYSLNLNIFKKEINEWGIIYYKLVVSYIVTPVPGQ